MLLGWFQLLSYILRMEVMCALKKLFWNKICCVFHILYCQLCQLILWWISIWYIFVNSTQWGRIEKSIKYSNSGLIPILISLWRKTFMIKHPILLCLDQINVEKIINFILSSDTNIPKLEFLKRSMPNLQM